MAFGGGAARSLSCTSPNALNPFSIGFRSVPPACWCVSVLRCFIHDAYEFSWSRLDPPPAVLPAVGVRQPSGSLHTKWVHAIMNAVVICCLG